MKIASDGIEDGFRGDVDAVINVGSQTAAPAHDGSSMFIDGEDSLVGPFCQVYKILKILEDGGGPYHLICLASIMGV